MFLTIYIYIIWLIKSRVEHTHFCIIVPCRDMEVTVEIWQRYGSCSRDMVEIEDMLKLGTMTC